MSWYLAKIVYRIHCGNNNCLAQFEDQLRLIAADSEDDAIAKACEIGNNEQVTFLNQNQQLVQWQFINVSELYSLNDQLDGAELFSTITEVSSAENYIRLVNDKSDGIRNQPSRKHLNLV